MSDSSGPPELPENDKESSLTRSVSQEIIDSGLASLGFGDTLWAPIAEHTFSILRDIHGRLWLVATRDSEAQICLLHQPPTEIDPRRVVLTAAQLELANSIATPISNRDTQEIP